jgi:hypothetical protein
VPESTVLLAIAFVTGLKPGCMPSSVTARIGSPVRARFRRGSPKLSANCQLVGRITPQSGEDAKEPSLL